MLLLLSKQFAVSVGEKSFDIVSIVVMQPEEEALPVVCLNAEVFLYSCWCGEVSIVLGQARA